MDMFDGRQRAQGALASPQKSETFDGGLKAPALQEKLLQRAREKNEAEFRQLRASLPEVLYQSDSPRILVSVKASRTGEAITISKPGGSPGQRVIVTAEIDTPKKALALSAAKALLEGRAVAPAKALSQMEAILRDAGAVFRDKLREGEPVLSAFASAAPAVAEQQALSAEDPLATLARRPMLFMGTVLKEDGTVLTVEGSVALRKSLYADKPSRGTDNMVRSQVIVRNPDGAIVWTAKDDSGKLSVMLKELQQTTELTNVSEGTLRPLLTRMGFPFEELSVKRRGAAYFEVTPLTPEDVVS